MSLKDKFKKVNPKRLTLLILVVPVLMLGAFAYFLYLPFMEKKTALEQSVRENESGVAQGQIMEKKLEELKAANAKLQQELKSVTERLPSSEQDLEFQDEIKKLFSDNDLTIKEWKVGDKKAGPGGHYNMTEIKVEALGSYHDMGKLMESIDGMARMAAVSDLTMSAGKVVGRKMSIPIKFTITAYSAAGGK